MTLYLNGQYQKAEDAKISVLDRGFIFGDGVYEVWRFVEGTLFEHERHERRLKNGLRTLEIDLPDREVEELANVAERLIRENGLSRGEGTFYVEVTRGVAPRTHAFPPKGTRPTVFGMVSRFEVPHALREKGAKAITEQDVRWLRCDVKTVCEGECASMAAFLLATGTPGKRFAMPNSSRRQCREAPRSRVHRARRRRQ